MNVSIGNRTRTRKRKVSSSVFPAKRDDHSTTKDAGFYGTYSCSKTPRVRIFKCDESMTSQTMSRLIQNSRPVAKGASAGSSKSFKSRSQTSAHVVCAISENLAKETCVASLDVSSPTSLHVAKQGNGQTYAETMAYLDILQPDEILLNEGRRNSQLVQKVKVRYGFVPKQDINVPSKSNGHISRTHVEFEKSISQKVGRDTCVQLNFAGETSTVIKFLPRSFFDQTKGADLLRRIARADAYDASIVEEYILLSSSHALLLYTQICLNATFSKHSLNLSIHAGGSSRMAIDRSSLLHLELLANSKTGKCQNSLIGTVDSTKTTVGSRLLRSNIMAPPTDINTINTRLDLVEAFIGDEDFFYAIMDQLGALPDINRMLAGIAMIPSKKGKNGKDNSPTARSASKGISALICVKSVLSLLPSLAHTLENHLFLLEDRERSLRQKESVNPLDVDCGNTITDKSSLLVGLGKSNTSHHGFRDQKFQSFHLLRAIIFVMRQPELDVVLDAVNNVFTDSTSYSTKAEAMRHQECFALKPKTSGMLDVLRSTFLANVDDIYRLADEYAERNSIRITVKHSTQRGYFLAIPVEMGFNLPEVFIQPVKCGRYIHCTTEEVHSLNARALDNIQDLLVLTHDHILDVLETAREKYDAIACLSDAIALLDVCHSFADNVASSRLPWTRPVVNSGNDLTIRNGRYGIDGPSGISPPNWNDSDAEQYVPNHTYAPGHRNFIVITGANGSGKSTYLKQLAIICVLAHCGSFVPAEKAIVPVRDRLCTRIGISDDQEHNYSTFLMEMKEVAFICRNAGPKSLVLIDELGRASSNEDGVAIAWSVSEFLRLKKTMTFFVTHYPTLTKLAEIYPGIWNQHMGATLAKDGGAILYSHTIQNGPCQLSSDYGIEIAATCGWPNEVVAIAKEIRAEIDAVLPDCGKPILVAAKESEDKRRARLALVELCRQLKDLSSKGDAHSIREDLVDLREAFSKCVGINGLISLRAAFGTIQASSADNVQQYQETDESHHSRTEDRERLVACDSSLSSSSSSLSRSVD